VVRSSPNREKPIAIDGKRNANARAPRIVECLKARSAPNCGNRPSRVRPARHDRHGSGRPGSGEILRELHGMACSRTTFSTCAHVSSPHSGVTSSSNVRRRSAIRCSAAPTPRPRRGHVVSAACRSCRRPRAHQRTRVDPPTSTTPVRRWLYVASTARCGQCRACAMSFAIIARSRRGPAHGTTARRRSPAGRCLSRSESCSSSDERAPAVSRAHRPGREPVLLALASMRSRGRGRNHRANRVAAGRQHWNALLQAQQESRTCHRPDRRGVRLRALVQAVAALPARLV